MIKNLTIVKIGGSVLTDKTEVKKPWARRSVIQNIAKQLSTYLKTDKENFIPHLSVAKGAGFILVHGAGSFGHPLAKRYKLAELQSKNKNNIGAAGTHCSVQQLNLLIADIFLRAGCPVFPLSPLCLIQQKNGRISSFYCQSIRSLLENGLIPLLHGDVVLDSVCQFSICSGDQIVSYLSGLFSAKRVFFLSDVDGIFTHDPKHNLQAHLLKKIPKNQLINFASRVKDNAKGDVSGSMRGKLLEIGKIKCEVRIFSGLKKGNLLKALQGKAIGTRIFT